MTPLQRMIVDALDTQGLSYRDVEKRSRGRLTRSTLSWLVNGRGRRVEPATLHALSVGLRIPYPTVREAYAQSQAVVGLGARVAALRVDQQMMVLDLIDLLENGHTG